MKDYPYLSDTKKAHSVSYLLMGACALFGLLALFAKTNKFLLWVACILAIAMYCFAMHYLDYHNVQGQSIKKYIFAFHCFAIHALLMMFAEIANGPGTLSYQVLNGLVDAMLVAALLALVRIYKSDLSLTVVACAAVVTFVLALLNLNKLLALAIVAAGFVLIYFAYKESIGVAAFGCLVSVLAALPLFDKHTPDVHRYLHILAMLAMMVVAYLYYKVVEKDDYLFELSRSSFTTDSNTSRSNLAAIDTPKKSTSSSSTRKRSSSSLNKYVPEDSWFIKSYQNKPYEKLMDAPLTAFKGVSKKMANDLEAAFNIKTISDLAESKYFKWAKEIADEAE